MGVSNFFITQIKRSLGFSKQRLLIIVISIFMGSCVTNAFLNIYLDIDNKMSKELKAYGANMLLSAYEDDFIYIKDINSVRKKIDSKKILAISPYLYFTPSYSSRQILLAGVDFVEFKKMNKFLKVLKGSFKPNDYKNDDSIYLGVDLAATLDKKVGQKLILTNTINGEIRQKTYVVKGIFSSGDEIDAMAFTNIKSAQNFSNIYDRYSYVSLILDDNFDNLNKLSTTLSNDRLKLSTIPSVSLREGAILEKIKGLMLLISIVILIISSTSVNTTLSSIIFARKKEIALHLALGASFKDIIKLFSTEVFVLALFSSLFGCAGGFVLAQFLGRVIFDASIDFRLIAFILAIIISLFFAALAAYFPIKRALSIDIVGNLRGE